VNFDPRNHTLPLEDVQRLHLGLESDLYDADPMEFSAETIAAMLQSVAAQVSDGKAAAIHAVVRALRGEDQHHRLELHQVRKGRHKMHHHYVAGRKRDREWLETLAQLEADGIKTESAIATIAERFGVSRASVFEGIKQAETVLEMGRSIERFAGRDGIEFSNPRPSKNGKA
jgi:hypothetical protein